MDVKEGAVSLKQTHNIYFCVQGEMKICNKRACLFAIWSSNKFHMFVQRIERDDDFFKKKMENQLCQFYDDWMLPELVDPRLARNMPVREPQAAV